ncbi:hypothetical protein [Thalassovita sp.]|jgi:hypothetical protein
MFRQIADIITRAEDTLLSDTLGMAALVVMTVVALHLPSLV